LNAKYVSTNFSTWTNGIKNNFLTNGNGRVTHISWGNEGFVGSLDLTNFSELKYLTIYNNDITKLTLTGCSQLINISATYNELQSFDSSASNKTEKIALKGNKLKTAKFKHNGSNVTVSTNNAGGSFSIDYKKSNSKKLTIYANAPNNGYEYKGIYNSKNQRVSSDMEYTFNPTGSKYYVKYEAF